MIDFGQIKAILKLAGINHLEIDIDENCKIVKFTYIFRGNKAAVKEFTFQEIKDAFEIKRSQSPGNEKPGPEVAHRAASIPPA